MIEFFVKRPITTIMFLSLFAVLGIVSYFNLNIEKSPKIEFPLVTVAVVYPGATPQEMESLVVEKVENALSELSEVKKIRSQSFENFSYIFVEFLLSADVNIKFIEVKDKIDSLLNKFPSNVLKPVVQKFDPFVQPVLDLVLTSDILDEKQLYEIADQSLKDRFLAIQGVANVDLVGGKQRQINVKLDPMLMKEHYISVEDISRMIQTKNMNMPGGEIENSKMTFNLKFIGEYDSLDSLASTPLITRNGEIIPLSAIAVIEDGYKKTEKIARFNGQNAIALSIKKSSDSNSVKIAQQIKRKIPQITATLPEHVSLDIATDNTTIIEQSNFQTEVDILIGMLLTVVILFLFTGNLRLTIIASLTIPLSIISALFLMDIFDFSINFLTLLAIASSLGTLISNTIVIVESFWLQLKLGKNSYDAAIDGTKDVRMAVLAATGTNLVVFLPIAFMKGMIGQFFHSFGLTVIFVTIFSLVISFTLTPMFCCYLFKNAKKSRFIPLQRVIAFLLKKYQKLYGIIFRFPKLTVFLVILAFFSIRYVTPYIPGDFFPRSDEDKIVIQAETPQGSNLDYTLQVAKTLEEKIKIIPELKSYLSMVGVNGSEHIQITVNLIENAKRSRQDTEIMDGLIPSLSQVTDVKISLIRGSKKGIDDGDLTLGIYGKNYDKMIVLAQQMQEKMEETGYFRSVSSSYNIPKKELCFLPTEQSLLENGVRDVQVGQTIRAAIHGDDSNIYKDHGKEYNISVHLDEKYLSNFEDIQNIHMITKKGLTPITRLGKLEKKEALPTIIHEDKERVIKLNGFLGKSNPAYVKKALVSAFKDLPFDEEVSYSFAGMDTTQQESAKEMMKAFFLAVILTYMLLAAILNSFSHPISIILSIATSFIGVFYALFFLEESINVASMLGMVMLVGLVVNNSILLIDEAIHKVRGGMELKKALWEATSTRFQMILMTSLAIILGILPQLRSIMSTKSSMGAVMIGGMLASIIFTFILTPISFYFIEWLKEKIFRKKSNI